MRVLIIILFAISFIADYQAKAQTAKPLTEQERFKLAAEYSTAQRGLSVLVMKGDKIIFEDYENGQTADMPWVLFSGTKSFSGVMLAAAIEDKIVSGFDERVSDTITEWKSDERKSRITLRQLLSLSSGIDAGKSGLTVPSYTEAINSPMKFEPGTHFQYGPVPYQTFGEFMTRKLRARNETVMGYLKRRILDPIGLKVSSWQMRNGEPLLPQGASLTAREWVKFGLFLKNGGKWNDKRIVKKNLLDELIVSSKANPAYGITFWLNHPGKDPRGIEIGGGSEVVQGGFADGISDLYIAAGAANQRLYIIPSLDMVIVRQGRMAKWDDHEFLGRLLYGRFISRRT